MANKLTNIEQEPVVTVCGKEARIYGPVPAPGGPRPLWDVQEFPHRGAALLFASEYEESSRKRVNFRGAA